MLTLLFSNITLAKDIYQAYRADRLPPNEVKSNGGFFPRGMYRHLPDRPPLHINLYEHANGGVDDEAPRNTAYVSTTESLDFAINWVGKILGGEGYVYYIKSTPNFLDVNEILGKYSPHPDEIEHAVLGVVPWYQIIGFQHVKNGVADKFIPNDDYKEALYQTLTVPDIQPQLAAFPAYHEAWSLEPWKAFANCGEIFGSYTPKKIHSNMEKIFSGLHIVKNINCGF